MNELIERIREINDANGWLIPLDAWEMKYFIPSKLCLIHSEVSECLEAFRNNDVGNFKEELADIIIRILDLTSGLKIPIEDYINEKLDVLEERPFRHGMKRI